MAHLLRSLFVGYFVAIVVGTIAIVNGYGPVSVVLGVWLGGSILSVVIAASFTPLEEAEPASLPVRIEDGVPLAGRMRPDLTAGELARWDADLMADRMEADWQQDQQSALAADASDDRKVG